MTDPDPGHAMLLVADADLLHRPRPLRPDEVLTVVTVPLPPGPDVPHTVVTAFSGGDPLTTVTRTLDGVRQHTRQVEAGRLLHGLHLGPALTDALTQLGRVDPTGHTPLFCATAHPDGWHTFSRVHLRPDAACFIRTSTAAGGHPNDVLGWVPDAINRHATYAAQLNSLDGAIVQAHMGTEIETKLTLPPDTALWPLAVDLHDRIADGALPEMAPRFRDPLETWDFANNLFEVQGPGDERGYVSFLYTRPGLYQVKRKNYQADALARHEHVDIDITITEPLADYVRDTLGLLAHPMPAFRRVRYDVKFESMRTGHHYGIFIDRCTLHADPTEALAQVEVEYLRSRSVLPLDEPAVFTEVQDITDWVAAVLAERGLPVQLGYYSKLSYLRDVVTRRPELLPTTGKDPHDD
jgi:hypothetical protein